MMEEVIASRNMCSDADRPLPSMYDTNVLRQGQHSSDVILTDAVIYRGPRRWSIKGSLLDVAVGVVSPVNNHDWWYYHDSLMGHYREHLEVIQITDSDYFHSNDTVILEIDENGTLTARWKARGTDWCCSTLFVNIPFPVTPAIKLRHGRNCMGEVSGLN